MKKNPVFMQGVPGVTVVRDPKMSDVQRRAQDMCGWKKWVLLRLCSFVMIEVKTCIHIVIKVKIKVFLLHTVFMESLFPTGMDFQVHSQSLWI